MNKEEQDTIEYKGKKYYIVKDNDLAKNGFYKGWKYYHRILHLEEHKEEILDEKDKEYGR